MDSTPTGTVHSWLDKGDMKMIDCWETVNDDQRHWRDSGSKMRKKEHRDMETFEPSRSIRLTYKVIESIAHKLTTMAGLSR